MLIINSKGVPIAKIVGGKYDSKVISVEDKPTSKSDDKVLGIANDAKLQLAPNPDTERQILYITGPSGSGKSTIARKYLGEYKKVFKDNPVYLFSSLPDDESLDDIEPKRLRLDASIYEGHPHQGVRELRGDLRRHRRGLGQEDPGGRLHHAEPDPRDRQALPHHLPGDQPPAL